MLLDNNIYLQQIASAVNALGNRIDDMIRQAVFVTGAGGMLGSCVIDMLIYLNEQHSFGIQIYAAGRSGDKIRRRFGDFCGRNYFHITELDVSKEQEINLPADYVIHAASNADPIMFANYPVDTILANVIGVKNVLDMSKCCHAKRILYVSSGEMYGQPDTKAMNGFCEDYCGYVDYKDARSCYPSGKRAAEVLCQSYIQQYGLDVVIARPCHCYGPTMTDTDSRALSQFFRSALRGEDIVLKSSGEMVRSHCYVADAAAGILTVLLNGICGEAYNIANPDCSVSIREVAELIAHEAHRKVCFDVPGLTEQRGFSKVTRAVLNAEKISEIGWRPLFNLQDSVADTLKILSN